MAGFIRMPVWPKTIALSAFWSNSPQLRRAGLLEHEFVWLKLAKGCRAGGTASLSCWAACYSSRALIALWCRVSGSVIT
jgi:hypothetical protein